MLIRRRTTRFSWATVDRSQRFLVESVDWCCAVTSSQLSSLTSILIALPHLVNTARSHHAAESCTVFQFIRGSADHVCSVAIESAGRPLAFFVISVRACEFEDIIRKTLCASSCSGCDRKPLSLRFSTWTIKQSPVWKMSHHWRVRFHC